jgi:hypothetical protein
MRHRGLPFCRLTPTKKHPPLPRFFPLQRFPDHREPPTPTRYPALRLRYAHRFSQPFDVLLPLRSAGPISSRCRSWGFPSRLFPPAMPYVFSNAVTLTRFCYGLCRIVVPGLCSSRRSLAWVLGFSQESQLDAPLVFIPFKVSCPE